MSVLNCDPIPARGGNCTCGRWNNFPTNATPRLQADGKMAPTAVCVGKKEGCTETLAFKRDSKGQVYVEIVKAPKVVRETKQSTVRRPQAQGFVFGYQQ